MVELVAALAVPGWGAWRRHRSIAALALVLGILVPLALVGYTVGSGRAWVALSLDTGYLGSVVLALVAAIAGRLLAVGELWIASGRPVRPHGRQWGAVALVVLVIVPLAVGAVQVGRARAHLAPTFAGGSERPIFDTDGTTPPTSDVASATAPASPTSSSVPTTTLPTRGAVAPTLEVSSASTSTTTTVPPKPTRPRSGVDPTLLEDVTTVLLLGGDAGPGRYGLRTDTMMLFSIHEPSGRAALISVPRDQERLLFPVGSALEARYPYGFTNLTNAVYPIVSSDAGLRSANAVDGVHPGVVAIAQGIGYSLDVTIDDYVLVDMQGFLQLIDAVGGVTVDVPKAVPMPGNVPGARTQYPDVIGPGTIHMDGTTALGYVRSRKADSDYQRTGRQRALLASLATQIAPEDVMLRFDAVTRALGSTLRTSLTPDELAEMLAVIGGETAIVESVGLVPPLSNPKRPDFQQLAEVVGEVRLALVTGQRSGW